MRLIILFFMFLFSTVLYAEEMYLIENPDGSVRVLHYKENSNDSVQDVLKSIGAEGLQVNKITSVDLPNDRADRKYWKKLGKRVVIDTDKKDEDEVLEQAKEAEMLTVLEKLKISKEEFEMLDEHKKTR